MNEQMKTNMLSYFYRQIAACKDEACALELDDRRDEAVFAKIRGNIYDVFRTVFTVASGRETDAAEFFLAKLDEIPRNWCSSLEQARQHGNSEKAHLEQLKLDTADEIRRTFGSIREVQQ